MNAIILTILYSIFIICSYSVYLFHVHKGNTSISPITWLIWFFAGIINSITYLQITEEITKGLIAIICTMSAFIIFSYAIFTKKIARFRTIDIIIGVGVIIIGYIWWNSKDERMTNFLLQFVYLISFIPTAINLIQDKSREHWLPWPIGILAYIINICVISLDYEGDLLELMYPIVNGIFGNGAIFTIILIKNLTKNKRHGNKN